MFPPAFSISRSGRGLGALSTSSRSSPTSSSITARARSWGGPASRAFSMYGSTTRAGDPDGPWTTCPSAGARGWCWPGRSLPPSRRTPRRDRCTCSLPVDAGSTSVWWRSWPRQVIRPRAGSRCCADATRVWTSGWPITWSTASVDRRLRVAEARCRRWWCRGRGPTRSRGHGERGLGGGREFQLGPARVSAVHPSGRVSGVGGARCLVQRRPRPRRRWRRATALRRTLELRPDLVESAGGVADEADLRLLEEQSDEPSPSPGAATGPVVRDRPRCGYRGVLGRLWMARPPRRQRWPRRRCPAARS